MINSFLLALPLTILIETTVLFLVSIFLEDSKRNFSDKNIVFAGIIASSLTLPYLYFVFPEFLSGISLISFGEISVTLIEAIFYMFFFRINFLEGLYISFLANLISFSIGLILF